MATGTWTKVNFTAGGFADAYHDNVETITELCAGVHPEGLAMKTAFRQWAQEGM